MKIVKFEGPFGTHKRWVHSWEEPDAPNKPKTLTYESKIINLSDDPLEFLAEFVRDVCKVSPFAAKSIEKEFSD